MLLQSDVLKVLPLTKKFLIDPGAMQKLLTTVILTRTQLTHIEIGLIGHAAYYDVKTKKKDIISVFKLSTVAEYSTKYGAVDNMIFPKLEPLANVLYFEDDGITIFDIDEKKDEIYIRWHSNLAIAAVCDVSLDSPIVKFEYFPIIEPSKKEKKQKEIKQRVPMTVSLEVAYDHDKPYSTDAVYDFLEKNGLI